MDGKLDILSGCYWTDGAKAGQIQLLKGNGTLDFAAAVSVENQSGQPLENLQITDSNDERQTETICTQQHAVDFDGDNDLDLVVGCFANSFYLYENVANPGEKPALRAPTPLDIKSPDYHAAPHLVDWDGDGDLDLLSGGAGGGVLLAENVGTREQPKYAEFERIVDAPNKAGSSVAGGEHTLMAESTRVWATDFNNDGLLDLLVGDTSTVALPKAGLSDQEFARRKSKFDADMAAVSEKMSKFQEDHRADFEAMQNGETPDAKFQQQMSEISSEMQAIYKTQQAFQTTKRTGYVWLLLRKPVTDSLSRRAVNDGRALSVRTSKAEVLRI